MTDTEITAILRTLERFSGSYEREAVDAAVARREEIIPYLIDSLVNLAENPAHYLEDKEYYLYVYGVMLLGHLQETRAHGAIIKAFSLPDDALYQLFGDISTEYLPTILFNTCGGSFHQIKSLIRDRQADDYVRSSGARALVYGVAAGQLPREEVLAFFSTLFSGGEAEKLSSFWSLIGNCILDLQPRELLPLLKEADEKELLDGFMFDDADIERALSRTVDDCLASVRRVMERNSLDDPHRQMLSWHCFRNREAVPELPTAPSKAKDQKKKKKRKTAKASRRKNRG